jgi:RHS repeat-associated protein
MQRDPKGGGKSDDVRAGQASAPAPRSGGAAAQVDGEAAHEARPLLPTLSLPKGGGALRGIGEKFSTNPSTGTGTLSVPIATSPGRGGFELGLELSYDSGSANGPFGIGWHLSTPVVTRKTDRGLPRYDDGGESDVFVLSGAEDLVPVRKADAGGGFEVFDRGDFRVQHYRPRTEGLFARIERWTNKVTRDVHWRAITRDNVLNVYGRSPGARVADPLHPARVFSWLLEETRDDRGNVARYTYKAEDGAGVDVAAPSEAHRFERRTDGTRSFLATAQRYLKRIQYGNRAPVPDRDTPVPLGDDDYLFEVVFDYGEHDGAAPTPAETTSWPVRPDPFSGYRATFEVRSYRLCRRVLVFHRFAELGPTPCLVRSTDLVYNEGPVATYLKSVTQAGYVRVPGASSYERATLPPLDLAYTKAVVVDELRTMPRESLAGIPQGVAGAGGQWADIDGEGISGVLLPAHRGWLYKANLGDGHLAPPAVMRSLPVPAELGHGAQQLVDIGRDGNLDLVTYAQPLAGYFERTPDGDWAPFAALRSVPEIDWDDPNLRFVDVDGDGFPDVLVTENDAFAWYRSRGKDGFDPAVFVAKPRDEQRGPAVVFADGTETIQLADMSGDGLVDIVRVRNGEVCYWPNLGYGRFGARVTLDRSPRFDAPDQFDPKRVRFADVDGSGTADIVYLGRDGVRMYLNQSGNSLSARVSVKSLPPVDSLASVEVIDLLGHGTSCLVWSSPGPGNAERPILYVDLMGGKKPHMLEAVVNNLGAETRIAYAPSTRFYLKDKAEGRAWLTRLAFPVQVVERIERYDHVAKSKLVTRYAYHHGYFDGYEREFRGFACVEQWDAESFGAEKGSGLFPEVADPAGPEMHVPPVRTVTWFHTGAWLDEHRLELALSKEYYGHDPASQDPHGADYHLPQTVFEAERDGTGARVAWSASDAREATRALRGRVLRKEIYAEDGTEAASRPYLVTEHNYQVRRIQPVEGERHGVFFAHALNTIELHYERTRDDPRVTQDIVLRVDAFGNAERSAAIAYPRRRERREAEEAASGQLLAEQAHAWVKLVEHTFANRPDEDGWYRVGVPVESITSELTGATIPERGIVAAEDIAAQWEVATEIPHETKASGGLQRRVVERQRVYYYREYADLAGYRDDAQGPLPLGEIGEHALAHRTLKLALTPGLVAQVYGARVNDDVLRNECRYVLQDGVWWAPSGRVIVDPARFFRAPEAIDPFGQRHFVRYDGYSLLVVDVEDPLGNRVTSGLRDAAGNITANGNDYRVLAPTRLCDANRNRTRVDIDALGLVTRLWQQGREGEHEGDDDAHPGVIFAYDMHAWRERRGPSSAHTVRREAHNEGGDPLAADGTIARKGFQHSRAYSDGSGREIMKKVQAAPGPVPVFDETGRLSRNPDGTPRTRPTDGRWIGTGRTVLDAKGHAVKGYEPFYSPTIAYEDEREIVEWGVTPVLHYDPLGRLVRTDHPDGTFARVVFDSWREELWDENDTVLDSAWYALRNKPDPKGPEPRGDPNRRAAWLAAAHALTPGVTHFDALGRGFLTVADNGVDPDGKARRYATRTTIDIEGNHRLVTDARGNRTLEQDFDVMRRILRVLSPDAGESHALFDLVGQPVRAWDPRGHVVRKVHDALQRPTHAFVVIAPEPERLVELVVYGEAHPEAEQRNLRTHACASYDGAGVLESTRFDFKGNPVETVRRLAREYRISPDWSSLGSLGSAADVARAGEALLEAEAFATTAAFDALDRITSRTTPDGSVTLHSYDESGLLESSRVQVRGEEAPRTFLEGVQYNARGQNESVRYGNGTEARFTYDDKTFRLQRQTLVRGDGAPPQDLAYTRDPVGNVVSVADAVSYGNSGVSGGCAYTYDALYQLVSVEGREHPGQQPADEDAVPLGLPSPSHPNDWQGLRRYRERYSYDAVGNLLEVRHAPMATGPGGWTRQYRYAKDANRLIATTAPGDPGGVFSATYAHDAAGNISRMPHLPLLEWDYASRLQRVTKQNQRDGDDTNTVYFAYDAQGRRVRKVYEHAGAAEERIYLGTFETYREHGRADAPSEFERQTLHVTNDENAIALVESVQGAGPARIRYQCHDALGSTVVELDEEGAVINVETFHPYGATALIATETAVEVSVKRYRYHGKERDDETGLYYYGARYFSPWLGRWMSADPAGLRDGINMFAYARNNPISRADPTGTQSHALNQVCRTNHHQSPPERVKYDFARAEGLYEAARRAPLAPPDPNEPLAYRKKASSGILGWLLPPTVVDFYRKDKPEDTYLSVAELYKHGGRSGPAALQASVNHMAWRVNDVGGHVQYWTKEFTSVATTLLSIPSFGASVATMSLEAGIRSAPAKLLQPRIATDAAKNLVVQGDELSFGNATVHAVNYVNKQGELRVLAVVVGGDRSLPSGASLLTGAQIAERLELRFQSQGINALVLAFSRQNRAFHAERLIEHLAPALRNSGFEQVGFSWSNRIGCSLGCKAAQLRLDTKLIASIAAR